jgi:hypothetical protein
LKLHPQLGAHYSGVVVRIGEHLKLNESAAGRPVIGFAAKPTAPEEQITKARLLPYRAKRAECGSG